MRLPRTLLHGKVRTSTLGLLLSFFAVLTLWVLVRPEPVTITEEALCSDGTCVTVRKTQRGSSGPTPTPQPTITPSPTPRPSVTPKPTPTPKAATPTPDPGLVTPTPTPVGGGGGLFGGQRTPVPTPTAEPGGVVP